MSIPQTVMTILEILAQAIGLAADLAKAGKNPAREIERIRAAQPELDSVEDLWQELLREGADDSPP